MTTPSVYASGLVKSFGQLRAVDGIDLEVRQGEIFGVLGPNGAGKTTMLKMLATLLPIDAGEAHIFGVDVAREPPRVRQLLGAPGSCREPDHPAAADLPGRADDRPRPAHARPDVGHDPR